MYNLQAWCRRRSLRSPTRRMYDGPRPECVQGQHAHSAAREEGEVGRTRRRRDSGCCRLAASDHPCRLSRPVEWVCDHCVFWPECDGHRV
eukprot:7283261-Prymnesium_polylepis.1